MVKRLQNDHPKKSESASSNVAEKYSETFYKN